MVKQGKKREKKNKLHRSLLRMLLHLGTKINFWVSYQPEPHCYHFLTHNWVFVSHLTETDKTETSVGTGSGWRGAIFDHLCGIFLGQHARSLPLVWVCTIRSHVCGAPSFWRLSCLLLHFCLKVLKGEVALLLGNNSLRCMASLPAQGTSIPAETTGNKSGGKFCLSTYLIPGQDLPDEIEQDEGRLRAGGGQEQHGSREARGHHKQEGWREGKAGVRRRKIFF